MRLSIARAYLVAPHRAKSIRPICSSSSPNPQIPLFLRPPNYSVTLTDVHKWHNWAKTLNSSVGSSFVHTDNGPDSTLLHRELKWLIQDAVDDKSLSSELENEIEQYPELGLRNVRLKVGIDELYRLWKQRIHDRRPFQYIVGCEHWRDLILSVEEGVLIPRPETEVLVDLVEKVVSDNEALREGLWVDLGTGSGAIAIGICRILEGRGRVIATDLSTIALAVAGYNVQRYGLQDLIELRQGSWYEPLQDVQGKLSGIISNPPYIPSDNIFGLQAEVGKHEPRVALDGGTNGMDELIHLCDEAAVMLKPGGFFAFETNGEDQCKHLVNYMENSHKGKFCNLKIVSDFASIPRFITGFLNGAI
ncbi:release factor glutamine methyltransferase [Cucumis melo var. makuwa]|uniref:Release factor glutamine methyltransferase n=1 Tax=Cucumis melo var. makuwa TaxID=1194695 RepID=A0A5A7UDM4_CUCMM|nr:release factor glutamine methyltransferase [Cucumis melo var. makuwa]TYK01861.1 release factor glutamine methyltransferase [Cucumis melo var. makuwa]